jgi:2-iminobutanoate/2-iminopropanoate deaminase
MKKKIYPMPGDIAEAGTFAGKLAFSNAVKMTGGEMLFISGQLAFNEEMVLIGKGDIEAQTRQVLENIKKAIETAGGTFNDIVQVQVYVTGLEDFRKIHDVRLACFDPDHLPASTLVKVAGLAHEDALIEINAIAMIQRRVDV